MIKPVIDYINVLVKPLGFNKLYGLVDQITRDDITIPACYDKKGSWSHLGMDKHFNSVYHRILSRDEVTREAGPVPGNDMITRSWQMRMVALFERNIYDEDSQYVADKMLTNLFRQVEHNNIKSLATQYGIMSVTTQAGGQSEGVSVWEQEIIGIGYPYNKELVIVAQDYSIALRGAETCFTTLGCGDEEIDVTAAIVADYCTSPDGTVQINSTLYDTVASGGTIDIPVKSGVGTVIGTVNAGIDVRIPDVAVTVNLLDGTTEVVNVDAAGGTITPTSEVYFQLAAGETEISIDIQDIAAGRAILTQTLTNCVIPAGGVDDGTLTYNTFVGLDVSGEDYTVTVTPTDSGQPSSIKLTL